MQTATAGVAQAEKNGSAPNVRPLRHLAVPAALLLVYVIQCAWFARTQSLTFDEPFHIDAGLDAWRNNRFERRNDQPPLARLLMTLPLVGNQWQVGIDDHDGKIDVFAVKPDPVAMATRGRAVSIALGCVLGVLLWFAARRLWSEGAANLCLALFAFSPGMIAHFSIIAIDGVAILTIFATAWQLVQWRRGPSWINTALLGLILGLLLLAKFSTPPFFLLTLALVLVLKPNGWRLDPRHWNWKPAIAAALIGLALLWAGYFFHLSHLSVRDRVLTATFPNRPPLVKNIKSTLRLNLWVPAGEYIDGLRQVKYHNRIGHPSFFLGNISRTGKRLYYPVAMLVKWPVVITALLLLTAALAIAGRLKVPAEFRVLALYPALMLLMALKANLQIGERHVLPVYPFVLLFCAGIWSNFEFRVLNFDSSKPERPAEFKIQNSKLKIVLLAALVFNAVDVVRYAPDYLAYFNIFVPPSRSWKLLTDSNLDWGQGLLAVRDYERRHPEEQMSLVYFGSVRPDVYGVRARRLPPDTQVTGTVIVSATMLSGQYLPDHNGYHWVLGYPVKEELDHNMLVFEVPREK